MNFSEQTLALIKALRKDTTTTGIGIGTGLNFYFLEPQAKSIYPVFYPLLASTPRANPTFNGMKVGGTTVNWKAITAIHQDDPSISEGNRQAFMDITTRNYSSQYKFLGNDTQVSFQAQATGLGFDDNIALSQLAMLNALLNNEERMLLYGNSGATGDGGDNGYHLGTTGTPTTALATGGSIPDSTKVTVYCVALTPWGAQMATSTALRLPYKRVNADGSVEDPMNGGTAKISNAGTSRTTTGGTLKVSASVTAIQGAVAYAWYVSINASPTTANAYFAGITPFSSVTIDAVSAVNTVKGLIPYNPSNTNQAANATGNATAHNDLTEDHSFNNLHFDGLMTWTFNTASASQPSYWKDLGGSGFTANGDGTIAEFEDAIDFVWNNYKISFDKIYVGGSMITSVSKAILGSSAGGAAAQRLVFQSDEAGGLVGGTKVVQYRSKFANTGRAKVLDVETHPWLPDGCVFFDLVNNPYPAAGNSIPSVRRIMSLEDHFSLKWPYRRLQHELGVYCFETVENYIPFGFGLITGAANKVN